MPDTGVLSLFYGKLFEVSITSILECTPYRGKSIMKAMTPELFGSSALSARALAATLCSLALVVGCVDEPTLNQSDMSGDMERADITPPLEEVSKIELVLDSSTPGVELAVRQHQRLRLKVQGFDSTGNLLADNLISQTSVTFTDLSEDTSARPLDRQPLVLTLDGNVIEVLEQGKARVEVTLARPGDAPALTDTVILNATQLASIRGTLPLLTTLRRGEPLMLNASLSVTPQGGAQEPLPLLSLCTQPGEVVASGAIRIYSRQENDPEATSEDLNFGSIYEVIGERTGAGQLEINCPALVEYDLPTSLTYHFRVESSTEVRAGAEHTCSLIRPSNSTPSAINTNLLCWGKNERGQVGALIAGRRQDVTEPTPVFNSSQGPIDVDTGPEHTCAIVAGDSSIQGTRSGDLYCWGDNRLGQSVPVDRENAPEAGPSVERPSLYSSPARIEVAYMQFAQACSGDNYSCALSDEGRLMCWGTNSHGQLGPINENTLLTRPTEIFPGTRHVEIGCGAQHVCATSLEGESTCWGRNHLGQLGQPPEVLPQSDTPIPLSQDNTPFRFEVLSQGEHTSCGLTEEGLLYCWGNNRNGQITDFIQEEIVVAPTRINLSSRPEERVESIAIGSHHACAITTADTLPTSDEAACLVYTLDMNDFTFKPGTQQPENIRQIDGTCADRGPNNRTTRDAWRSADKTPGTYEACHTTRQYCWGDAQWGQILKLDATRHPSPQLLTCQARPPEGLPSHKGLDLNAINERNFFNDYRTITVGDTHSCSAGRTTVASRDAVTKQMSVDTKEKVWCWGRSDNGKLGSKTTDIVAPSPTSSFKSLAQNASQGATFHDRSGRPVGQPRQLAIGRSHGCVRTCLPGDNLDKQPEDSCEDLFDAQHHVLCWGSNQQGQRGEVDGFDILTSLNSTAPDAFQIQPTTALISSTLQTLVSGAEHLCTSHQTFTRQDPAAPRYEWDRTTGLRCWGKNSHQQAGASIGTSAHGNPNTGISGGPDTDCQVLNFGDRLGDLHTCGFTLTTEYADLYKELYNDPQNMSAYDWATNIFQCWNADREPNRPSTMSFSDLIFSARGQAYCWGNGSLGQHGRNATIMSDARPSPDRPAGGSSAYYNGISSSDYLSCGWSNTFSTGAGTIDCWGYDPHSLVKDWEAESIPTSERILYSPTKVRGWNSGDTLRDKLKAVEVMAMGEQHVCVISNPQIKYVVCWGDNTYGQIGGATQNRVDARDAHFVKVSENDELSEVTHLTAGRHHTCALTRSQRLYCWGRNDRGQVGALDEFGQVSNNLYTLTKPYEIKTFNGKFIKDIMAFDDHTCALVAEDAFEQSPVSIHCWGENDLGQSACWQADPIDLEDASTLCTSSRPWSRRAAITQAYP